jgi:hypothetical protein
MVFRTMTPNGPAIKGGCVPAFFPKKRGGALFAVFALRSLGEGGPGTITLA